MSWRNAASYQDSEAWKMNPYRHLNDHPCTSAFVLHINYMSKAKMANFCKIVQKIKCEPHLQFPLKICLYKSINNCKNANSSILRVCELAIALLNFALSKVSYSQNFENDYILLQKFWFLHFSRIISLKWLHQQFLIKKIPGK